MKIDLSIDTDSLVSQNKRLLESKVRLGIAIKRSLTEYLDIVVSSSRSEIQPDNTGLPNFRDRQFNRTKQRAQKTRPDKLTSRTGRLLAGLGDGISKWSNLRSKLTKGESNTFKASIHGGGKRGITNNYLLSFSPFIKNTSPMMQEWKNMASSSKTAKLKNAMRFKHDSPQGLRGATRPFLSVANQKNQGRLNDLMINHLIRELK